MPRRRMKHRFGKETRVKILGGNIEFRVKDPHGAVDWMVPLNALEKKINDWSPVFKQFGEYMLLSIERTHQSEGRPSRWQALTPATLREKEREGFGGKKILERTGRMMAGYRYEANPKSFSMRNLAPYHGVHQYGSKKRNIPARVTIQLLLQDKQQFTRMKNKHLGID